MGDEPVYFAIALGVWGIIQALLDLHSQSP